MKHLSRAGGKYSGSHTTIIPAAAIVSDIAHALPQVTKISLGFIKGGLPSARGQHRVKIGEEQGNVLLSVRDNTTFQEIRVYTSDLQATKLAIARGARNAGLHISFKSKD